MKYILVILLFFVLKSQAQTTYLKVADKPEYAKYLEYCLTPIDRDFIVEGKVTVLSVNGLYVDGSGNYYVSKTPTITWFKIGAVKTPCEPNQMFISTKITLKVKRREPSIPDFYKYWKTNFIQEGLMDERSGGF